MNASEFLKIQDSIEQVILVGAPAYNEGRISFCAQLYLDCALDVIQFDKSLNPKNSQVAKAATLLNACLDNFRAEFIDGNESSQFEWAIDAKPSKIAWALRKRFDEILNEECAEQARSKIEDTYSDKRFLVGFSFPGEYRPYIEEVANRVSGVIGKDLVFYDNFYSAELARPNLDTYLQDIYLNQCQLIVVLVCSDYASKNWCKLEWRSIREVIAQSDPARLFFVKGDDGAVDGVFSIDGYIDARTTSVGSLSEFILDRLSSYLH